MRRRSNRDGGSTKARGGKAATPKRRHASKSARHRSSATASEIELARRTRERDEAVEQFSATSEVLKAISASAGELEPVFGAMLDNATRICDATSGLLVRAENDGFRIVASMQQRADIEEMKHRTFKFGPSTPIGRAVQTRQIVHVANLAEDRAYLEREPLAVWAVEQAHVRTVLVVPMLKQEELIGVFGIEREEVKPFTDKQIALVQTFAAQAVIAIENARLFNELRQSLEQQTATADALRIISSSPGELKPVFNAMLENAVTLCEAEFGHLFLFDGEAFHAAALHSASQPFTEVRRQPVVLRERHPDTPLARMARTKAVIHIADVKTDKSYIERVDPVFSEFVEISRARTDLLVPMLKETELVGAFVIYRLEVRPFTDKQIELVKNFAAQAVIAIENARPLNELRHRTDDLTESLERQTATSEVLQAISSSIFDLEKVFGTLLETAMRLCESTVAGIWLSDGDHFKLAAARAPSDFVKFATKYPVKRSRGTVTGRTALEGRTLHIPDVLADPEYTASDYQSRGQYRSALGVPLLRQGETIGVFTLTRSEARPFNTAQIELVQNFAAQAVIAIENARLFNELRESLQQQTATSDVLKVISRSAFDLQTVLDTLMESAARLCQADKGAIMQQDGEVYRLASNYGLSREAEQYALEHPLRPDRGSMTGRVALEGRPIHIPDVLADPEYQNIGYQKVFGYRTDLGVPLLREGTTIGIFSLTRDEVNPFTEKQIELATTFADQAVIAIENARLLNELRESLQQQTATADVLKVISRSTFDLQVVLNTLVESAAKLCE